MTPPRIEHVRTLQIRVTFGENFQVALRRLLKVLQKYIGQVRHGRHLYFVIFFLHFIVLYLQIHLFS